MIAEWLWVIMKHLCTHLQMFEFDCCQWICRNVQGKTLVLHVFAMATCCLVAGSKAACTKEGSKWWTIAVADRRTWLWTCYLTSIQNQRCNLGGPFSIVQPKKDGGIRRVQSSVSWFWQEIQSNHLDFQNAALTKRHQLPRSFKGSLYYQPKFHALFFLGNPSKLS